MLDAAFPVGALSNQNPDPVVADGACHYLGSACAPLVHQYHDRYGLRIPGAGDDLPLSLALQFDNGAFGHQVLGNLYSGVQQAARVIPEVEDESFGPKLLDPGHFGAKGHGDPGIELVDIDIEHAVAKVLGFYGRRIYAPAAEPEG